VQAPIAKKAKAKSVFTVPPRVVAAKFLPQRSYKKQNRAS
jgi:hypothetical protein